MSFLQPNYLWGLLALAIPIIVHLFNFRRYKRVYFSDISILKSVKSETNKRSRLKQWLVLIFRLLAIFAVVMIFAQPVFNSTNDKFVKGSEYVFIYLDNSQSMRVKGNQGTLLTHAKNDATSLLSHYDLSDKIKLLTNDNFYEKSTFTDKNRVLKQIEGIQFSGHAIALSQILKRIERDMQSFGGKPYKVYVLSDMQTSSFDLPQVKIDSLRTINIIKKAGVHPGNLYIDSCWFDQKSLYLNQQAMLNVRIKNSGDRDYEKVPLKLMVNNKQQSLSLFSVLKNQTVNVQLTYLLDEKGFQEAKIVIDDQPISFDNRFYFNYFVGKKIKVTEIYEKEQNPYIEKLFEGDSLVQYASQSIYKINFSELKSSNLLIINELENLSTGLKEMLFQIINEKQTDVLLIPTFKALKTNNEILSILKIGKFSDIDTLKNRVGELAIEHPLYHDVFSEKMQFTGNKNYDMPMVYKHLLYKSNLNSRTLMRLENGDPFLISDNSQGINQYVFSAPIDSKSTSLPSHSFIVPTLYKMALISVRHQGLYHVIGREKPIVLNNSTLTQNSLVHLKDKSNTVDEILPIINKNNQLYVQPNIQKEGHYRLYNDSIHFESLSYNINPMESDLSTWNQSMYNALLEENDLLGQVNVYENNLETSLGVEQGGRKIWSLFVILALLSILGEVLVLRFMK